MTPGFTKHRISRSVAWRLAAGVSPSVLAVIVLIALFYYGQYEHQVPATVLVLASALTLVSIVVSWRNASYFAARLERLALHSGPQAIAADASNEFDRIEQAVGDLGSALTAAQAKQERTDARAAACLHDQATMLAGAVNDSLAQLDQVRLPLQILLESPFGDLNDNQEELLRDARGAADSIDESLRRLGQLADIDREAFHVQHELVQVNDVVRSVLPLARAAAERNGARTESALEPGLPRVFADRARLAESLSLFVTDAAAVADQMRPLTVATARDGPGATIRVAPVNPDKRPPILASRLIEAQGGSVALEEHALLIRVGMSPKT